MNTVHVTIEETCSINFLRASGDTLASLAMARPPFKMCTFAIGSLESTSIVGPDD